MKREEVLEATLDILNKASFHVSERCASRCSCFDFAARKDEIIVFVKVLVDISHISSEHASELQRISKHFSAIPLFIGDQTRKKILDNDTVYMRYNIYAITQKTFGNVVLLGMHPLIEAGPGGYYVNLDANLIRKRRLELELSVGKLSELIGLSRRTIYGYERGMAKASVSVAYELGRVLGNPVALPIDVFKNAPQSKDVLALATRIIVKNLLLRAVLRKLVKFNFRVEITKMAPFDFVAQFLEGKLTIIGGVAGKKENDIDQRAKEIMSVSEVANAQPIFITDGKQVPVNDIPIIHYEELIKLKAPDDLISQF